MNEGGNMATKKPAKQETGETSKRVVLMSDLHTCGLTALTTDPQNKTQEQVLSRYNETITHFGKKPDALIVNGDAVEGPFPDIHDSTQNDMAVQVSQAVDLIAMWEPKETWIISGTPRHTGQSQMWEKQIAAQLNRQGDKALFRTKGKIVFNGWFRFECRHKIGGSSIPHGRATAPLRAKVWNILGAALKSADTGEAAHWPDLIAFAHVHYYQYHEDAFGRVVTLPSWQAHGSRYPDEACDGHVDLGAAQMVIPADAGGRFEWDHIRFPAGVVDRWDRR